jgi:mono/diheme cytochrome c family protein
MRLIRLIPALAAVGALTACGGGDSGGGAASQAQPAASQPAAAPAAAPASNVQLPEGVTQAMVTAGHELFNTKATCFACHGQDGVGSPLGPALNDSEWIWLDGSYDAIVNQINTGTPQPKQFAGVMLPRAGINLTDEEVAELAAYVYSISRGG